MTRHLFAYGTLQIPAILEGILQRMPESQPAELADYARYRIRGESYPGIIPLPGASTDGTLYFDITETEWRKLDRYESDLYRREPVKVRCGDGQTRGADAYIIPPQHAAALGQEPWTLAGYRAGP